MSFRLRLLTLGLSLVSADISFSQVPQMINYQGGVMVENKHFNGVGQFKFALVDGGKSTSTSPATAGTREYTTFWSNDGSSRAGYEPNAAVPIRVSKGAYSVLLGDTNLANMIPIPPVVFTNSDVRLRVWFNDGESGFAQLAPDQRIAAVGYAMVAATVPDGSITSAK